MGYWVLEYTINSGAYVSGLPKKDKIKRYEWNAGKPLAKKFPKTTTLQFDSKYPGRRTPLDFLDNSTDIPIVSPRVKAILDELQPEGIEWLQVKVKDHKGNALPEPYYVLNLIGGQDAVDLEKSDVIMDNMFEDRIFIINKLVLNPKGIDKDAHMFRLGRMLSTILIDDSVKAAFKKAGIKGYGTVKAEGWDGHPGGEREG